MVSKYAPRPGHIPGAVINLGGHELVLAPLNLDGVRAAQPYLDRLPELRQPEEVLQVSAELLLLSLARNYPDMTAADVAGLLDMDNAPRAIDAMTTQRGYKRAKPGELTPASP